MLACLLPLTQSAGITYSGNAKPIGQLLSEISPMAGVKLTANPQASSEVVLVSVSNLPLQDLLAKIAAVTSCRWEASGDGYMLRPDSAVRSREENKEENARLKAYESQTESLVAPQPPADQRPKTNDQDMEDDLGDVGDLAGNAAIGRLLQLVDLSVLAHMKVGDRIVWVSNNPTQIQGLLGGNAAPIVQRWVSDYNLALAQRPPSHTVDEGDGSGGAPPVEELPKPVTAPISRIMLVASRSPESGGLLVDATATDAKGESLLQSEAVLADDSPSGGSQAPASGQDNTDSASPGSDNSARIEFSDESKLLKSKFSRMRADDGFMGLRSNPPEAIQILDSPGVRDPLSFNAQDSLLSYAKAKSRQLVADMPDSMFALSTGESPLETVKDVQDLFDSGTVISSSDDGKVLAIMPAEPAESRESRLDRASLSALVSQALSNHHPSLETVSAFASANSDAALHEQVGKYYASAFLASPFAMTATPPIWSAYRLYDQLKPTERESLRAGIPIPFANLDDRAKAALYQILFGAENGNVYTPTMSFDATDFGDMDPSMYSSADITDRLPAGIPANGVLGCKVKQKAVILLCGQNATFGTLAAGPEEIAVFQYIFKSSDAAEMAAMLPRSGFMGQETILNLDIRPSQTVRVRRLLQDIQIPKASTRVSGTALPSDFQAEVDKFAAQFKNINVHSRTTRPQTGPP
ncbi:MAG TPA: hypothetical protein VG944_04140 [Fimbriimonas sp.]|nr:hypothetical protein [Fimbriimonas sp.]